MDNFKKMRDTYDFVFEESVLTPLNSFFRCWREFKHYYTYFEEEAAAEAAKNAEKKPGFLASLFNASVSERLRNSYRDLKDACNTVLSAIIQRLG